MVQWASGQTIFKMERKTPCSDWGFAEAEEKAELRVENRQLRERNELLAQMLCELCGCLENNDDDYYICSSEKLSKWWNEHKILDAHRRKEELAVIAREKKEEELKKKRDIVLNKLTKEERELLGL